MNHFKIFGTMAFAAIALISSCSSDDDNTTDPLANYTKLHDGYALGAATKVEVWATKNFFVGYNQVAVVLYDSLNLSKKTEEAHVVFQPKMTMTMGETVMVHACPVENPAENAVDGLFKGAVVYQMPTQASGTWQLGIKVQNHDTGKTGTALFDVSVTQPSPSVQTVFTAITEDASKLILTMVKPQSPKVGINDIEFTIHKKASMMEFPADDSYIIEIEPEMPSMGHGSPNNVNPTNQGNGHYVGKVNFTMTGEWRINVLVKKDGEVVSSNLFFNITL
jgi:hypothetical protein